MTPPKRVCHTCRRVVRLERKRGHSCEGPAPAHERPIIFKAWNGEAGRRLSSRSKRRAAVAQRYRLLPDVGTA